jgi:glutamate formiminotransferase
VLECVVNVSEGRRPEVVAAIAQAAGRALLDVHTDPDHHRSVLTLAGEQLEEAVRAVAEATVRLVDLRSHEGAHPRLGALDVVPYVALDGTGVTPADAVAARDRFARWAGAALGLPCFCYGPERRLPEVRRRAFRDLVPDAGPARPHPSAGATAVGARPVLVAYNLWLESADVALARSIASAIRGPALRALGLDVGGRAQVSCNLVDPASLGPAAVHDLVASRSPVARAELVGLLPRAVLDAVPRHRWAELDVDAGRTIEGRLEERGLA